MTNTTPSRVGDINAGGGDVRELFLKEFAGEVLNAFDETNVMMPLHMVRSIASGKSAAFPVTWKFGSQYHVPGVQRIGTSAMNHNEIVINLDGFLSADTFLASIDELLNHYDVRSIYSAELGNALARSFDQTVQVVIGLGARASATVTGGNGGTVLTNAAAKTDGPVLAGMIWDAGQAFDEKDVPENDRYVTIKPAQYNLLAQTTNVLNRDWGGKGVYADGTVLKIGGIHIVKTNNLPSTNIASSPTGAENTYHGDFSTTAGLVFHKTAAATVKRMDMSVLMTGPETMATHNGTLLVAQHLMGHGFTRPESAVELKTA